MRAMHLLFLSVLAAPGIAQAMDCSATAAAQPLRPTVLAPVANELAVVGNMLGAPDGVLADALIASQSVDQVLLRIRIESCQNMATITPAPGTVSPDDPAAYKPRTEFDNTPWRFNMSQNGKKMTADEFSAWMKAKGVRVARGAAAVTPPPASVPVTSPAAPTGTPPPPAPVPATSPTASPPQPESPPNP